MDNTTRPPSTDATDGADTAGHAGELAADDTTTSSTAATRSDAPVSPPGDSPPLHLAVVIGSTRVGRLGPRVAAWFARHVADDARFSLDVIDLLDVDLSGRLGSDPDPSVVELRDRLDLADAVVIVTPEYNHSFPAPLKAAIDLAGSSFRGKAVGFVSYGGMVGGQRAVEQLRQIVPEVRAMSVRETVSFHNPWQTFGEDGSHADPVSVAPAAEALLDELAWWAVALRTARHAVA